MRLVDADKLKKWILEFHPADAYWAISMLENAPTIDAEPIVHAHWIDKYGKKYANQLYECSACKETALYKTETDELGKEHLVQVLSAVCPHCGAKMTTITEIKLAREEKTYLKRYLYDKLMDLYEYHKDLRPRKHDSLNTLMLLYFYWGDRYNDDYIPEKNETDNISIYLTQKFEEFMSTPESIRY